MVLVVALLLCAVSVLLGEAAALLLGAAADELAAFWSGVALGEAAAALELGLLAALAD